jgi:hypothetical protein
VVLTIAYSSYANNGDIIYLNTSNSIIILHILTTLIPLLVSVISSYWITHHSESFSPETGRPHRATR